MPERGAEIARREFDRCVSTTNLVSLGAGALVTGITSSLPSPVHHTLRCNCQVYVWCTWLSPLSQGGITAAKNGPANMGQFFSDVILEQRSYPYTVSGFLFLFSSTLHHIEFDLCVDSSVPARSLVLFAVYVEHKCIKATTYKTLNNRRFRVPCFTVD